MSEDATYEDAILEDAINAHRRIFGNAIDGISRKAFPRNLRNLPRATQIPDDVVLRRRAKFPGRTGHV